MHSFRESTFQELSSQTLNLAICCLDIALKLVLYFFLSFLTLVIIRVLYRLRKQVFNCDLKDKPSKQQAVLITGATSGIGLALARHLHRRGYSVIAGYFTTAEPGYEELKKLDEEKKGENSIYFVELDVRSEESISRSYDTVKKILADHGLELHALVNNAGIASSLRSTMIPQVIARNVVETNLLGPIFMTRKYFPLLIKASNSRVVNVSSLAAMLPFQFSVIYGVTKSGLAYYANSFPLDSKKFNVRFVTIYPGFALQRTDVVIRGLPNHKEVTASFSGEEKQLYDKQLENDFETFRKALAVFDPKRLDFIDDANEEIRLTQRLFRFILKASTKLLGDVGGRSKKLEDTCFMENFDNAISLRSAPNEMYAGNRFYSIVVGSFLECTSHYFRTNFLSFAFFENT